MLLSKGGVLLEAHSYQLSIKVIPTSILKRLLERIYRGFIELYLYEPSINPV